MEEDHAKELPMPINEIVATVSIVRQLQAGCAIGAGSGFFYTRDDRLFLVTNQHVCLSEKEKVVPDSLRLRLHTDPNEISQSGDYDVPLYDGEKHLWKIHPRYPQADIALIELPKEIQKRFFIKAWSKARFLPPNYLLDPGEDVFVIGYPLTFHDGTHNLPIFRNAMIASSYRVPFQGQPFFLTDANLHPGTSGSPVVTKPKSAWVDDKGNTDFLTGTVYFLVGVHSGTVDLKMTGGKEIGLGAAWYAELVEDIAGEV